MKLSRDIIFLFFIKPINISDPLSSLLPGAGSSLYAEQLRERELRERSALLGLGGLYPPEVRGPAELYGQPSGPGPHVPPTSIARPELSPVTRHPLPPASPLSRSRDLLRGPSPGASGGKMSQGPPMFSPHSSAPFAPPSASANNSSLSDKLKLGFSSEARPPPAASSHPGLPHEAGIKREAEPYLRPSLGHSSASASLVTS